MSTFSLRQVSNVDAATLHGLVDVLVDCVHSGASVSFMAPLSAERALAFWQGVARGVAAGERLLLVAEDAQGVLGTVQLVLDQPDNQPHRADLSKMLVHQRGRRQGVGAALMQAAEAAARAAGKTLLVLDTANPRAFGGVLRRLRTELGKLPGTPAQLQALQARLPAEGAGLTLDELRGLDDAALTERLRRLCLQLSQAAWHLADDVGARFFTLAQGQEQRV